MVWEDKPPAEGWCVLCRPIKKKKINVMDTNEWNTCRCHYGSKNSSWTLLWTVNLPAPLLSLPWQMIILLPPEPLCLCSWISACPVSACQTLNTSYVITTFTEWSWEDFSQNGCTLSGFSHIRLLMSMSTSAALATSEAPALPARIEYEIIRWTLWETEAYMEITRRSHHSRGCNVWHLLPYYVCLKP